MQQVVVQKQIKPQLSETQIEIQKKFIQQERKRLGLGPKTISEKRKFYLELTETHEDISNATKQDYKFRQNLPKKSKLKVFARYKKFKSKC